MTAFALPHRTARDYALAAAAALVAGFGLWLARPDSFAFLFGPVPAPVLLGAGLLAGWLALHLVSFPITVPAQSGRWRRMAGIAALGLGWSVFPIAIDLAYPFAPDINVPLPAALVFYPVIAVWVSGLFHILPLALCARLLGPRAIGPAIVVLAALEPVLQVALGDGPPPQAFLTGLHVYAFTVVQLVLLWRAGFLESLALRLGFYLGWHILWGTLRLGPLFA